MHDVLLTFALEQLHTIVAELEEQFAAVTDDITILDFGCSCKLSYGYIVVEWLTEVDEAFLTQLQHDTRVLDFCVYTIPMDAEEWPFGAELAHPSNETLQD